MSSRKAHTATTKSGLPSPHTCLPACCVQGSPQHSLPNPAVHYDDLSRTCKALNENSVTAASVGLARLLTRPWHPLVRNSKRWPGNRQIVPVCADVTDEAAVGLMAEQAERELGSIDILVNNAGSCRAVGPLWTADTRRWRGDVETSLFGTFLCVHALLPRMFARRAGRSSTWRAMRRSGRRPTYRRTRAQRPRWCT